MIALVFSFDKLVLSNLSIGGHNLMVPTSLVTFKFPSERSSDIRSTNRADFSAAYSWSPCSSSIRIPFCARHRKTYKDNNFEPLPDIQEPDLQTTCQARSKRQYRNGIERMIELFSLQESQGYTIVDTPTVIGPTQVYPHSDHSNTSSFTAERRNASPLT